MKNLFFRKEKMRNQPPSTTTTNPPHSDLITSFAELTSTSIEEATSFLESHNFDLDSAVSNFLVTTATTTNNHPITLFIEITSSSIEEATFFLESQNFDLDSAVSTFFEATTTTFPTINAVNSFASSSAPSFKMVRDSSAYRSRSPSPPPPSSRVGPTGGGGGNSSVYRNAGKKEVTSNSASDDVEDGPQEYYTGAHKSGQLVQDPSKHNDVDSLFEQARRAGAEDGTLDQPEPEVHTISFWTNGFTVNDGPLRRLEDPQNASFLESIRNSECPEELKPVKERAPVQVSLVRKMEDYPIRNQRQAAFVGVGRALGSTTSEEDTTATIPAPTNAAPTPFVGLVVDDTLPSTPIKLRLGDGTRMVSRFNLHHTVSNIRSFIDASRPGGPKAYQLLTTGFPPKQLNDLNQTIQEAGLANSVVIQKL